MTPPVLNALTFHPKSVSLLYHNLKTLKYTEIYRNIQSYTVLNNINDKTREDSGSITPNRRQKSQDRLKITLQKPEGTDKSSYSNFHNNKIQRNFLNSLNLTRFG